MTLFEPKPRFVGAPLVCVASNLMAFESVKSIGQFLSKTHGSALEVWQCHVCKLFHFWPKRHYGRGMEELLPVHLARLCMKGL